LRASYPEKEEFMLKAISAALLVGGIVLLYFGGTSFHSLSNDVSRFFTGSPTNKTIWLIAGGVIATLAGLIGLAVPGKR
jgi:NO-binding membrane sensor protein with MHYT domain